MATQPWMKFYPSDWRGSTSLKLVSMAARGLWIEMLCIMHEAEPYGHLIHRGSPLDDRRLAAMVGQPIECITEWLAELEREGVFERKRNGVIFSRRMEADEQKRRKARDNGKMGGNPSLSKTIEKEQSDNPQDKAQRPETRDQKLEGVSSDEETPSAQVIPLLPALVAEPVIRTDLPTEAFRAYNEVAKEVGLPIAKRLSPERRKKLLARLKEHGLDGWCDAMSRARVSVFLQGQNTNGWRADLDFFLQPESLQRTLEGKYERNGNGQQQQPRSRWGLDRERRLGNMAQGALADIDAWRRREGGG